MPKNCMLPCTLKPSKQYGNISIIRAAQTCSSALNRNCGQHKISEYACIEAETGCWGIYLDLRRGEVIEGWRKSHYHELCDFYTLANIITVKKLRMMRWEGHVANKGDNIYVYRISVGKTERYCIYCKKQCTFRRHNNSINITYTINMLHVSALLSHHQA